MTDTTEARPKAPWHLWVVGVVSLLWNAMGATDFTMTQTNNEVWLKMMTPEQLAYIHGFPLWSVAAWGVATWGSFIGSLLLLFRRALAVQVNAVVVVCALLTSLYTFGLSDGLKIMGGGVGHIIFNAVIILIAVLLLLYARAMRKRGVLR